LQILEIAEDSSERDIRRAYRKLSLMYHPDKRQGNEELFIRVTKAYEALTDPVARENFRKYGNPDGRQNLGVGLGLPAFLGDKENFVFLVAGYLVILIVVVPSVIYFIYQTCKGVQVPSLKRRQEMDLVAQVQLSHDRDALATGGFALSELVAENPDLQEEAYLAMKSQELVLPFPEMKALKGELDAFAFAEAAAAALPLEASAMAFGPGAASMSVAPGRGEGYFVGETGRVPVVRTYNLAAPEEGRRKKPEGADVRALSMFRYGMPPTEQHPGFPQTLFAPPAVLERNHLLLWAHMFRMDTAKSSALKAVLEQAGGKESLQTMLLEAEQVAGVAAQAAAAGFWDDRSQYEGKDVMSFARAEMEFKTLARLVKSGGGADVAVPALKNSGKKKKKISKGDRAAKKAAASKAKDDTPLDIEEATKQLDVLDAMMDYHRGLKKFTTEKLRRQNPAQVIQMLQLEQRVNQAVPPTVSPLAQFQCLNRPGLSLDAIRDAVIERAAPSSSDTDPRKAKGPKKSRSPLRASWPEWLQDTFSARFNDSGEVSALLKLSKEERGELLGSFGLDFGVANEVEALVTSMPQLDLEVVANVKRFDLGKTTDPNNPVVSEVLDPFSDDSEVSENEFLSVTVALRHANLDCVKIEEEEDSSQQPVVSEEEAAQEEDDDDEDDDEEVEDEAELLAGDDGIAVRKSKAPKKKAVIIGSKGPNDDSLVPEPHAPRTERPITKAERWALFLCNGTGWILQTHNIWQNQNGAFPPTVEVVTCTKARVDVELPLRFLPGPGTHQLYIVAMSLDYAGLDIVQELGTIKVNVSTHIARTKERAESMMKRLRERQDAAAALIPGLEEGADQESGDGSEAEDVDAAEDEDKPEEEGVDLFSDLRNLVKPTNQMDSDLQDME
jgi:hypothetical protein